MFGARIKIMWEEQLVDPPIDYINKYNIVLFNAGDQRDLKLPIIITYTKQVHSYIGWESLSYGLIKTQTNVLSFR